MIGVIEIMGSIVRKKEFTVAERTFIVKVAMSYVYTKDSSYKKLREKYGLSNWMIHKILHEDLPLVSSKLYEKVVKTTAKNKERSYQLLEEYKANNKRMRNAEKDKLKDMQFIKG